MEALVATTAPGTGEVMGMISGDDGWGEFAAREASLAVVIFQVESEPSG